MVYFSVAALSALLLSLLAGYVGMPVFKKLNVRQTINELGPANHALKQGIPTMGGITFIFAGVLTALAFGFKYNNTDGNLLLLCVFMTLLFGMIGFLDDYIKVVKHRNEGLTVKQKLALQIGAAVLCAVISYYAVGSQLILPFTDIELKLGFFYIPIIAFVIVAVDNSANILDGLDGLLSSNSVIAFIAFGAYCVYTGYTTENSSLLNAAVFCACMASALIGFLKLNTHPAGIFMGDVGSLAIGGAFSALGIVTRGTLMLPFMLVTMLISSLSDFLQVAYMRRHKGRKLMRLSPLHHHLNLGGMPETHVVNLYNILTFIGCAVAFILFI